jgi:hypothetical protein
MLELVIFCIDWTRALMGWLADAAGFAIAIARPFTGRVPWLYRNVGVYDHPTGGLR